MASAAAGAENTRAASTIPTVPILVNVFNMIGLPIEPHRAYAGTYTRKSVTSTTSRFTNVPRVRTRT